jgi:hypothetical protein
MKTIKKKASYKDDYTSDKVKKEVSRLKEVAARVKLLTEQGFYFEHDSADSYSLILCHKSCVFLFLSLWDAVLQRDPELAYAYAEELRKMGLPFSESLFLNPDPELVSSLEGFYDKTKNFDSRGTTRKDFNHAHVIRDYYLIRAALKELPKTNTDFVFRDKINQRLAVAKDLIVAWGGKNPTWDNLPDLSQYRNRKRKINKLILQLTSLLHNIKPVTVVRTLKSKNWTNIIQLWQDMTSKDLRELECAYPSLFLKWSEAIKLTQKQIPLKAIDSKA